MTKNMDRRLKEHRNRHTKSTSHMQDIRLIYKEEYPTFDEARKRELYLKSAAGRRFLRTKNIYMGP